MKQPREQEGPHQLSYGEQERCAVEGRRIDGSGACTEVRTAHGWWADQGKPGADRWRFTIIPQGQRIELLDSPA